MNYQAFKCNSQKEYLGFCNQKGFIYSMQVDAGRYVVVALQNGNITSLIMHSVQSSAVAR